MDLWVRSQDGERLGIIQYIEYAKDDYGHHLIGWRDKFEGTKIATYKTKERALEVLDEIQSMLLVHLKLSGSYEECDLIAKNALLMPTKVYTMPKE